MRSYDNQNTYNLYERGGTEILFTVKADNFYEAARICALCKTGRFVITDEDLLMKCNIELREGYIIVETVPKEEENIDERFYSEQEVAEMLYFITGDTCPCDFNGINNWLPDFCKIKYCPHPDEKLGCWKEFIKYFKERRKDDADM